MITATLTLYLITLPDGRCLTVEADSPYLARAAAALEFGMDELPPGAQVMEMSS